MSSPPQVDLDHDPQRLTARLQEVGGKLLLATESEAGRWVATPLAECVQELRGVWAALREVALDFDPSRVQMLQQRQRELGTVLEVLGGAATRLSATGERTSAKMTEELGVLDGLEGATEVDLLTRRARAVANRVRGTVTETKEDVSRSAREVARSALLIENADRELTKTHERDPRDHLTRVSSRYVFDLSLAELAAQLSLIAGYWCVVLVEIDNIEAVNKKLGDRIGDALLFRVAGVLRDACDYHPGAIVARTGGREFGVILPRCPLSAGRRVAEHIRAAVERARWECKVGKPGGILATTVSVGVVEYRDGEAADELLDLAERSLDQARQAGRNAVVADG